MIKINNLMKSFNDKVIFDDVNIEFCDTGEIYCILGESGAGKSTLFQILFGLDNKYEGQYILNGVDAKQYTQNQWSDIRSSLMQIVYQDFKLLENFSVYDNLNYAMNINVENREDKINDALKKMDLAQHIYKKVNKLSGGEKQRLAFARAIINNPKLILLDEPTGNLDDKNANIIMQYISTLKKDGSMIIIITHDSRVIPYCSNILEIVDKNIITKSKSKDKAEINKIDYEVISKQSKINSVKYTTNSIKQNLLNIILNNIPVTAIFIVFICTFSLLWTESVDDTNLFYNGLDSSAIYLTSANYTNEYRDDMNYKQLPQMDDGVRINFSDTDLENVKNIDGVEDALIYIGYKTNFGDINHNKLALSIDKNELSDRVKSLSSFVHFPDKIDFEFSTMNIPYDYFECYNSYSEMKILVGESPQDYSNEILIPEFYAYSIDKNLDNVIGSEINLPIILDQTSKMTTDSYTVCGVYSSSYSNNLSNTQIIYIGYREQVHEELLFSDEGYERYKNNFVNSGGVLAGSLYETKESFLIAMGTGKSDMVIKLIDPKYDKSVSEELSVLFPNLKYLSHYEYQRGEYKSTYINMLKLLFFTATIIALLFGLIILFLNKSYLKRRNKELAILYSLGYNKNKIYSILIFEYVIVTTINYFVAYIILFGLYKFYLQYTANYLIFSNTFSLLVISVGYIFIIITTLFSVIFSINAIKLKKLQNYLR